MKPIRCNRFVAVGLALLLLGGCSAPTDIPASSSSEVSLSASSGVSSGALSSLQRDADGVLVIPPEMFDRENATAFPSQQSPNLWEIDFPIHYAKMYLQYYFGP